MIDVHIKMIIRFFEKLRSSINYNLRVVTRILCLRLRGPSAERSVNGQRQVPRRKCSASTLHKHAMNNSCILEYKSISSPAGYRSLQPMSSGRSRPSHSDRHPRRCRLNPPGALTLQRWWHCSHLWPCASLCNLCLLQRRGPRAGPARTPPPLW